MSLPRMLASAAFWAFLVGGCSDDSSTGATCEACEQDYYACSSPNVPEVAAFEITSRYPGGCSGKVKNAPMHLKCEPLAFCWDNSDVCHSAKLTDLGTLWLENDTKCY
ncbi:MAG: hypothetical protein AMXMBFR22_33250 [Phycisphaerae bacterium]